MLTYLIYVLRDLTTTAVLVGLALAYARAAWGPGGVRTVLAGVAAGFAAAVPMAVLKQTTSLIDTGAWNMYLFSTAFVLMLVFLACFAAPIARSKAGALVAQAALALFVAARLFYKLPDVYLYPANFDTGGQGIVSTDFLYRIIGYVVGIVVALLICMALFKSLRALHRRPIGVGCALVVGIIGIVQMSTCLRTMQARRIIGQNHTLFEILKWFSNSEQLFVFAVLLIGLVLVLAVIARSLRDIDPYDNPAQHRKNRALWRNRRRWGSCFAVCLVLSMLVITVVNDYVNRAPELVPAEEVTAVEGAVRVPFASVDDGHLHRFAYTTEKGTATPNGQAQGGVAVRFIVIQKPNSSAFGIGLDACEICGETGYFERDGQVVCKLCDVVMNINTIGFKGGCNPIPIDYSLENGEIVISAETLAAYEKTFKA